MMRRPTRTRRLSIAAMVSLLGFVVVASAGVRSLWIDDYLKFTGVGLIGLKGGHVYYIITDEPWMGGNKMWGFGSAPTRGVRVSHFFRFSIGAHQVYRVGAQMAREFEVVVPLWPLLFLLLIAPTRWLIARSASARAFPVVTQQS